MNNSLESMLDRMRALEKDILAALQRKEQEFFYEVRKGNIRFTDEARARHHTLAKRFSTYVRGSRVIVLLTTPVIWACLVPIALVDMVMSLYQAVCFPIYGIPKVRRGEHIQHDRHKLAYLNWAEKLNCEYCAYANGVLACATEIAARTEQYWCPIKHALRMKSMHSRYRFFFDYGDAEHYREHLEKVRRSFQDIEQQDAASVQVEEASSQRPEVASPTSSERGPEA